MPTPNERKALWFLALVALSGSGVRLWRAHRPPLEVAETAAIDRQLLRIDSARTAPRRRRGEPRAPAPPMAPGATAAAPPTDGMSPVDLDRADSAQIAALPWIGPALAQRIVAYRDSAGGFGGIGALCAVRGIGPGLAARLRPLVTFTGPRRPLSDECDGASRQSRKASAARSRKPR
jgi:hypothetical protein